jgi:drug/metabolite transporter (DMT)-like permease
LVYPLARGTGPALSTTAAIVLLQERPTGIALIGVALIIGGVILLTAHKSPHASKRATPAIAYGLLTGLCIATYSVWDKYAVSDGAVHPLFLEVFASLGISAMLMPTAVKDWSAVRSEWQRNKREVLGVAVLSPLSYLIILYVLTFTPLSYVAPTREISILVGALLGTRFLDEKHSVQRLLAAATMVAGVVALALG